MALAPLGRRPPARSALNVATLHGVGGGARRQIQIGWGRCGDRPTDREREGEERKNEKTKRREKLNANQKWMEAVIFFRESFNFTFAIN